MWKLVLPVLTTALAVRRYYALRPFDVYDWLLIAGIAASLVWGTIDWYRDRYVRIADKAERDDKIERGRTISGFTKTAYYKYIKRQGGEAAFNLKTVTSETRNGETVYSGGLDIRRIPDPLPWYRRKLTIPFWSLYKKTLKKFNKVRQNS